MRQTILNTPNIELANKIVNEMKTNSLESKAEVIEMGKIESNNCNCNQDAWMVIGEQVDYDFLLKKLDNLLQHYPLSLK